MVELKLLGQLRGWRFTFRILGFLSCALAPYLGNLSSLAPFSTSEPHLVISMVGIHTA